MNRVIALPDRELDREVFLDRDLLSEVRVQSEIRDSETALAENIEDLVPLHAVSCIE